MVLSLAIGLTGCEKSDDPQSSTPLIPPASTPTTSSTPSSSTTASDGTTQPTQPTDLTQPTDPTQPTAPTQPTTGTDTGSKIADLAVSLVGTSFKMGGVGPTEFDNPGFVYYCYRQQGITIPRRAPGMAQAGTEVAKDQLQPGDVVIFSNDIGGEPAFVGIYIGNQQFVACNNPETTTKIQKMNNNYFTSRYITARRYS